MAAYQLDGASCRQHCRNCRSPSPATSGSSRPSAGDPSAALSPGRDPADPLECGGWRVAPGLRWNMDGSDEFETLLMTHYQRDSSEARQLMEDLGNGWTSLPWPRSCPRAKICWTPMTTPHHPPHQRHAERRAIKEEGVRHPHRDLRGGPWSFAFASTACCGDPAAPSQARLPCWYRASR